MDLKAVKLQILHGSIARRVVLRTFLLASAISMIPLLHVLYDNDLGMLASVASCDCAPNSEFIKGRLIFPFVNSFASVQCEEHVNLTVNVAKELIAMKLLNYSDNALCVGEGSSSAASAMREMGISNAVGVNGHHFFTLRQQKLVYELNYKDDTLGFVFFRDLDKLSVPALLLLQIERVLRPGGVGAVIISHSSSKPNGLILSATPVSSVLKRSNIVHVRRVNNFTLVVFKKRSNSFDYFEQYRLPKECPSISTNRPFVHHMEPLLKEKSVDFERKLSTLSKFVDVSRSKRPVYIDIGTGKALNSNAVNRVLDFYPLDPDAFNIYIVDHNTSILLSYIRKPGVTFVYHPDLAGNWEIGKADYRLEGGNLDPSLEDEEVFDFLGWFKETVEYADFVVLKMNAKEVELKFLWELFESGAICSVDELFLGCSERVEDEGLIDLFESLRKSGVFVHQWWDENTA